MMDTGDLSKPAATVERTMADTAGGYRPEIDGLRAVAVLSVLLFHAGYGWFSGGYVGVDVFFVISGFLITRIIANGLDTGTFSFTKFYRRRIRRLFPAYLVLIIAVVLVGFWLSLPKELIDLGQSLVASAGFATNVLFWQESGYFAGASEIKPLLHTWSLSVEEQFYLVFPALLLLMARFAPNHRAFWVWILFAASLGLSEFMLTRYESATFYLLPTRAWELLLGSGLALLPAVARPRAWLAHVAGISGLLLIAGAVVLMTPLTSFPGLNALAPCVGAAAIIWAGPERTIVNRLLSVRAMTFIGKISYSLYLWHWPVFAYYRYYNIEELSAVQVAGALLLSFVLAVLSWKFVEQPFRSASRTPRFRPYLAVAISSSILVALGLAFIRGDGLRWRMDDSVNAMLTQSAPVRDPGCMAGQGAWKDVRETCTFPADAQRTGIARVGDSHAHALLPVFADAAARLGQGLRFYGYSACPPVPAIKRIGAGASSRCHEWNDVVVADIVSSPEIETVVIVARHSAYLLGFTGEFGPSEGAGGVEIALLPDGRFSGGSSLMDGYFERLDASVAAFRQAGKRVVLVLPVPEVGYDVPTTLALMLRKGADPASFVRPYSMFQSRQAEISSRLSRIADIHGASLVAPEKALCDGLECRVVEGDRPLYYDDDHLSLVGASLLLPGIIAAIQSPSAAE